MKSGRLEGKVAIVIFSNAVPAGTDMAPIMKSLGTMTPMGRIGKPKGLAAAVLFFATDEAPFSGAEVVVDGGVMSMHPDISRE